jgi:hypothetical protein
MAHKTAKVFRKERSERDNEVFLKEHLWKTLIGDDLVLKPLQIINTFRPLLLAMLRLGWYLPRIINKYSHFYHSGSLCAS